MKYHFRVFAVLAMSLMSSALVPSLSASDLDKRTVITISQPVAVERTILPAGQYVLRLQGSSTTDVIYIFNGDETRLITTIQAIHAYRLKSTEKSEFKFYGSPSGQPTALHTSFYPGDESGFEFRQPRPPGAAASGAGGD